MNYLPTAHDVVNYWRAAGLKKRWFSKDAAFDADFKSRFEAAHHAAARGELDGWQATAEGALALVVLLDQFPRNAWRDSGHMFATDGKALAIADAAIAAGLDRQIESDDLRSFFYMPFMHSESLAVQERSVILCGSLNKPDTLRFAILHRDLIRRFGRFPHRNTALGRSTTPEERAYLDGGGFSG
ncbi:DUF924 domain-containing protein [Oxalobacteraceae bacterium CAVE-383]|nr:DUF924 domain-containing protein [Oxalobacteraceae bacterium CAVE-383]